MFVRDFVYVEVPAARVKDRLLSGNGEWLRALAVGAYAEGEELRARIGPGESVGVAKTVTLEMGSASEHGDVLVVPVKWEATGAPGLFPRMDATLELAAFGPDTCQLTLLGRYEVPFGPVGQAVDRLLLHRVAEATVRSLLKRMADALADVGEKSLASVT